MKTIAQLLLTFLLNAAWQITVIVACAALADWLLRGIVAQYQHALWVIALVASLFFPLLSCSALLKSLSISGQPDTEIAVAPIVVKRIVPSDLKPIENSELQKPAATTESARRRFSISPILLNAKLAEALGAIYLFFIVFRAGKLFRAWRRTRTIIGSVQSGEFSGPVKTVIARCQKVMGVGRLRIFSSVLVPVPITLGVVNPLVILPADLVRETDEDVLTSAIGHELVHVARRDYILNLIYEFIYVPLSFHPAAVFVRRRIKQTRELCCDERVARSLINPEDYARSLVRLIGSVPISRRLAANTTIGMTEADILEVRIMSLLRRTTLTARRKTLLLAAASVLLMTPCLAAAEFALNVDIAAQEAQKPAAQQTKQELERKLDQASGELKRAAQQLREEIRVAPEAQRRELEERLREVQQNLERHERMVREFRGQRNQNDEKLRQMRETIEQMEKKRPENEARMKELQDRLGQLVTQNPDVRLSPQQLDELRRAEREIELQQKELTQGEKQKEEKLKQKEREVKERTKIEDREQQEREEKEAREKQEMEEREAEAESRGEKVEMKRRTKDEEGRGREERARRQAELTRDATISMDRAIQIALSQHPGKVLACSLDRDGDKVFYHVVIISGDGEKSTATYVSVSATDGQILKAEKEKEKREQEW